MQEHTAGMTTSANEADRSVDAGLQADQHYVRKLPPWRYHLREALLPLVRWETPYLAEFQRLIRSPFLDSYFAMAANLGTHTFFMIFLPILYWCGYTAAGRALVHMLALGVFWSGWIKDLLCLPRPLSPPLQRITMSGSAALEYGFPSTHSTNAVSVAMYLIHGIHSGSVHVSEEYRSYAILGCYAYAISIMTGRIYCGMHGFFDVMIGAILGVLIGALQIILGPDLDHAMAVGDWTVPALITVVVLLAVRFHPEPADNCPCYDDSVSFAGVVIGIEVGHWHFIRSGFAWTEPVFGTIPFSLESVGVTNTALRLLVGVVIIFVWRAVAKPTLLTSLPPLFRQIEEIGLSLPRRFFTRASQYTKLPTLKLDDNVIPAARDIPAFFSGIGYGRRRTVSVGPQSEADAREMLAQQSIQRKQSLRSLKASTANGDVAVASPLATPLATPMEERGPLLGHHTSFRHRRAQDERVSPEGSEMEHVKAAFEGIEKPRVRYDVEVVTKLVVYTGIGLLSVEWNPILFSYIGLAPV